MRLYVACMLCVITLVVPASVRAFSDPNSFALPVEQAGGGGRFFTGSPADGYTCAVCHGGVKGPHVRVSGLTIDAYRPGAAYEVLIDWADSLEHVALELEITDSRGASAGTLRTPPDDEVDPSERCIDTPSSAAMLVSSAGRTLLAMPDCGALRARFLWIAPDTDLGPLRFAGGVVTSNAMQDVEGDGVTVLAHVLPSPSMPSDANRNAGCSATDVASGREPGALCLFACMLAFVVHHSRRRRVPAIAMFMLVLPAAVRADDIATALYVRTDTDHTTVISPHARFGKQLGADTTLDVAYTADVWTSASIDIRTSASVRPVSEQRNELDVGVRKELEDLKLGAAYRFSTEPDYDSHGLTLDTSYDLANKAATLALSLHLFGDRVGRAGDPQFSRDLWSVAGRASFTQVLDASTFVQLDYELAQLSGYQASPYRFVGFDGTGFGCQGAMLCVREHMPEQRTRHAFALLARRALGDDVSVGLTYRFYADDWDLSSHTLSPDLSWMPRANTLLSLRYRFYTQGAASFYRARYTGIPRVGLFTTRDRELSPLNIQHLSIDFTQTLPLNESDLRLDLTLDLGGSMYRYADFPGLRDTRALEVTTAAVLTL